MATIRRFEDLESSNLFNWFNWFDWLGLLKNNSKGQNGHYQKV